jgi:hypothetical protein
MYTVNSASCLPGITLWRWQNANSVFVFLCGIVTEYGLNDRGIGVRIPMRSRIFLFPRRLDRFWGAPSFLSIWYRGTLFPAVKRQGREADHLPPTSKPIRAFPLYPVIAQWNNCTLLVLPAIFHLKDLISYLLYFIQYCSINKSKLYYDRKSGTHLGLATNFPPSLFNYF